MIAFLLQGGGDVPNWIQLGIGGALAVFIYLKSREDTNRYIEQTRADSERYADRLAELASDFKEVVVDNSRVNATLCERLASLTDRLERDRVERAAHHKEREMK